MMAVTLYFRDTVKTQDWALSSRLSSASGGRLSQCYLCSTGGFSVLPQ